MPSLTVASHKGGTGKTTTAVNLAAAWAIAGLRVLLVDLDPAGSATAWLGADPGPALAAVILDGAPIAGAITPTAVVGLEVVPAAPTLAGADRALAGELGAEALLARALRPIARRYDRVILDTPPGLGLLVVSALVAAPAVLVPVQTRALPLSGLAQLLDTVARVAERLERRCRVVGIVPAEVNRTRLAVEVTARLRDRFGPLVTDATIPDAVALAEAPSHHVPISAHAPGSAAAAAFDALAVEVTARLAQKPPQPAKPTKGTR